MIFNLGSFGKFVFLKHGWAPAFARLRRGSHVFQGRMFRDEGMRPIRRMGQMAGAAVQRGSGVAQKCLLSDHGRILTEEAEKP